MARAFGPKAPRPRPAPAVGSNRNDNGGGIAECSGQFGRRRWGGGVNDARRLRQSVDHVLSEEEGQIQRGQSDRERDQQNIQICRDTVEAPQPFFAGAVGQKWFSQHC